MIYDMNPSTEKLLACLLLKKALTAFGLDSLEAFFDVPTKDPFFQFLIEDH